MRNLELRERSSWDELAGKRSMLFFSLCDSSTVVSSCGTHCDSVCFCMFVDEACCLDAHAVCSRGWHGTEGIWQCQEGGLTDGEHYIIAAPRVIEDAVDHGVCIQAECWVCLSVAAHILKCIKFVRPIWGIQRVAVCFWVDSVFSLSLCLSLPLKAHGSPSGWSASPHSYVYSCLTFFLSSAWNETQACLPHSLKDIISTPLLMSRLTELLFVTVFHFWFRSLLLMFLLYISSLLASDQLRDFPSAWRRSGAAAPKAQRMELLRLFLGEFCWNTGITYNYPLW